MTIVKAEESDPIMRAPTILSRELLTARAAGGMYRRRCSYAAALLLALLLFFGSAYFWNRGELSIREMAAFSNYVFGLAAICQVFLTIWLVPACVAAAIAEEKERRTLTSVLTTRLSSAEIVLGKLAAGLIQYASLPGGRIADHDLAPAPGRRRPALGRAGLWRDRLDGVLPGRAVDPGLDRRTARGQGRRGDDRPGVGLVQPAALRPLPDAADTAAAFALGLPGQRMGPREHPVGRAGRRPGCAGRGGGSSNRSSG